VPRRFDRYALTAGYNAAINERQFQVEGLEWPVDYRRPDETYLDRCVLEVGGERFELNHAKGETDDHTWTWVPGRGVLCCGDLFIWATPNAGNPQKAQRYPREWAQALRAMARLDAEVMLPGHGLPVVGRERVKAALADTAALLESICEQTLALMNTGAPLDEVLHSVEPPPALVAKPYLKPVYDEPEFIVRNLWRLYGGWYDGNPAHLKPAREAELAAELAGLAGGADRLAERALELARDGSLRVAGHLAELALQADPGSHAARDARAEVNERRAEQATSTMARGIFSWAAADARRW
jgi:alkyl sulfatase BDS1-like metallo-beta-lactamase superfamily hydrolase